MKKQLIIAALVAVTLSITVQANPFARMRQRISAMATRVLKTPAEKKAYAAAQTNTLDSLRNNMALATSTVKNARAADVAENIALFLAPTKYVRWQARRALTAQIKQQNAPKIAAIDAQITELNQTIQAQPNTAVSTVWDKMNLQTERAALVKEPAQALEALKCNTTGLGCWRSPFCTHNKSPYQSHTQFISENLSKKYEFARGDKAFVARPWAWLGLATGTIVVADKLSNKKAEK